jgi:hypothetical protein
MYSPDPASLYYVNEEAGRAYARPDADVNPGSGITVIGGSSVQPFFLIPNRYTFSDDIVWSHGAHSVTAGFSVTREFDEQWQSGARHKNEGLEISLFFVLNPCV